MGGDDRPDEDALQHHVADGTRRRIDDILQTLADRHRRDLLYYLRSVEVTDVETLARLVAADRTGTSPGAVSDETHEQIQVELVHVQLPQLDDLGLIEFDQRSGTIRCRDLPPLAERFVTTCMDVELED